MSTLYDEDFYAWTQQQALLLQEGKWHDADVPNIAEELETLGRSERHALESRLEVLVTHLLKWRYQPEFRTRSRSWRLTILEQRRRLLRLLAVSPSLCPVLAAVLHESYPYARRMAQEETGLALVTFPEACPWSMAQVLDSDFWPEG